MTEKKKEKLQEVMFENEKQIRRKQAIRKGIVYFLLTLFAIFIIVPFYWMILTSLKVDDPAAGAANIFRIPPSLWLRPSDWEINNYWLVMTGEVPYGRYMFNTVIVAGISTVGTVLTTIFASFAFARLNFRGRDAFFMLLIATMMIPGEMFVITNFLTVSWLGWVANQTFGQALAAMTLPFMTSIFYIFFLRQTFKQVPNELYYAAKVDGTSDLKYLWKIMVPIAKPTIITITILNAMGTWNAFIWPNLVTQFNDSHRLVSNGLRGATYVNEAGRTLFNQQMAAAFFVTLPLLITFLLLKKYIMRGVSRSGIKG
ncbi:carbohydrate ABC transporter permease [Liberiplasma polymorphum]|uniref:carbohydrate ABC transporter permease n=1 Tax=Liberiplasma polymorphum TaxID=3374570 RepID=UPI003771AF31